jgi:diguanylate cyclase
MGGLSKFIDFLQVSSNRRVLFLTGLCTAFTITASVGVVWFVLSAFPLLPTDALVAILAIAGLIPLIIAPPLSFILLHILRLLTTTLGHVDQQVRFDPLTGVYARNYFLEKCRGMLDEGGAFLMVDADHFKKVNDTYGHDVGDEALRKFASALRAGNKPTSLIGRLGGEEFGVFIPKARFHDADTASLRMSAAVCNLCHTVLDHEIHLTASIGGAVYEKGMTLEQLTKLADQRLYHAKRTGRNRAVLSTAPSIVPDFSEIEFWDAPGRLFTNAAE